MDCLQVLNNALDSGSVGLAVTCFGEIRRHLPGHRFRPLVMRCRIVEKVNGSTDQSMCTCLILFRGSDGLQLLILSNIFLVKLFFRPSSGVLV